MWASTPQRAAVPSAFVRWHALMESVSNRAAKNKRAATSEAIKMQAAVDRPRGNPGSDCSVYLLHSTAQLDENDAD